ncbi:MAG: histidine kinase dimerization/phosphoacceptor domain -containing protein [Azoarcus sp.]|nr:histidine kinase dimerization/phosphoacceptor domain -containing protein [Azoarcus sp.]
MLHELQLHQVELEQQNESLRAATVDLENSRNRYRDLYRNLYELAPVGYLTLSRDARIATINMTGASLLGEERHALLQRPFMQFVTDKEQDLWSLFFRRGTSDRAKLNCELNLVRKDGSIFTACVAFAPIPISDEGTSLRVTLADITDSRRAEQARVEEAFQLRDALTREVHHRIKNNLQVVVGLLRRAVGKHPQALPAIEAAIAQVQAVAVVHGLYGQVVRENVMLCELLPVVVSSVSELTGLPFSRKGIEEAQGRFLIKESEAVAVALILNELLTNAVKHSVGGVHEDGMPQVRLTRGEAHGCVSIMNRGCLPADFDFEAGRGGGTGLGLVRALMPTLGMRVTFRQSAGLVEVEVRIGEPVLSVT